MKRAGDGGFNTKRYAKAPAVPGFGGTTHARLDPNDYLYILSRKPSGVMSGAGKTRTMWRVCRMQLWYICI